MVTKRPALPPYDTVIFDLDGTLVDSRPGIVAGYRYMLGELGHGVPLSNELDLDWMIGPPIEQAMARLLARFGDDRVALGVSTYRDYYRSHGLFDAQPYEGIPEVLAELTARGKTLLVGTSKLVPLARRLLDHLQLVAHFAGVHGAEPDGRFGEKGELLRSIVTSRGIDPRSAVMVGDREHDVRAALACGLAAVGVTYGYGSPEELRDAGATVLCDSVGQIPELV